MPSVTTEAPVTDPAEETTAEDEPPLKSSGEGPAFVIEVTGDQHRPPAADEP
jgi:hypothetical protein